MKYYYLDKNDDVHGPLDIESIRAAVMAGRLNPDVKVTPEGKEAWTNLSSIPKENLPSANTTRDIKKTRSNGSKGPGSSLKSIGLCLIWIGLPAALYFTLIFDPSVEVTGGHAQAGERVNNIGKLNTQTHAVLICTGAALAGCMLYSCGRIENHLAN